MKAFTKMVCFAVAGSALICSAFDTVADTKDNPYVSIVDRNPFGLKPAPPPPDPAPPPPAAPPAKVVLTGITSLFGPASKRALLEITEQEPGKPGNVVKPILREGERSGSIEVVSINLETSTVHIKNGAQESDLKFEDASKSASTAPKPGFPGMPTPPAFNPVPPTQLPGAGHTAAPTIISPGSADNSSRGGGGVMMLGGGQPTAPQPAPNANPNPPVYTPPGTAPAATLGSPDGATRIIPSRPVRMQPPAFPPTPGGAPKY